MCLRQLKLQDLDIFIQSFIEEDKQDALVVMKFDFFEESPDFINDLVRMADKNNLGINVKTFKRGDNSKAVLIQLQKVK